MLLFDADMGLANLHIQFGMSPKLTLEHIVRGEKTIEEITIEGPGGIDFLPGGGGVEELANLDLLISTCTSVPHLAGALGKPTWLMLAYHPDWRWFLNDEASPWYQSVRLFRQPSPGDWAALVERMRAELEAMVSDASGPEVLP